MPSSILRVHGLAMLLDKLSVSDYLKPTSEGTYSLYVSRTPYLADSFVSVYCTLIFLSVLHPATTHPWPSKCCSLPIQKQCCTISPETVFHSIARKCIALSVVHHQFLDEQPGRKRNKWEVRHDPLGTKQDCSLRA